MAKKLLQVLGRLNEFAESFLRANDIKLPRKLSVRANQIVAEDINLLADGPAGFIQALDGGAEFSNRRSRLAAAACRSSPLRRRCTMIS